MADLYGNYRPQIPSRRVSMLGLGMPGNVQGKIDDGVRRSVGMKPKMGRLPGFPENPSLQGHPPLQWSVGQVGGIGAIPVRNVGDQARGMPPGPQRDSTTAVPMGGWQNHPSTRGLQEYKPTTPMYQRLHDITNPPPSPLIGSPGGGQGFFNVPPESNGGRFSSQSPGMPSIPIHWQPLTDGREVNTPNSQEVQPPAPALPGLPMPGSRMYGQGGMLDRSRMTPPVMNDFYPSNPFSGAQGPSPMSPQEAAAGVFTGHLTAQENQHRNWIMGNSRVSPEDSSVGEQGLNPTAPLYPAHPYAGKFPIQRSAPDQVQPRDTGVSNRTILAEINAGSIPSNLIPYRPGKSPEEAKYADKRAFENNKEQWAVSDKKRAENATREFEAQKLAYQRRRELAALAPRRRDMAESWIQSQFRQENPALFARGVNSDMLKYGAAMNARQRMDAPNLGGYSPQDAMLMRQKMYFDNAASMTPEQRVEAQRMLGLAPPSQATPGVYPPAQPQPGGGWNPLNYNQGQGNPGFWLGGMLRKWMGY